MQHFSAHFCSRLLLLCLLLVLTALRSPAQGQPTTVVQADSLKRLLRKGNSDTNRVEVLLKLSEYYQRRTLDARHNRDSALTMARQAGKLSEQLSYKRGQEEAVFLEGKIYIKGQQNSLVQKMLARVSEVNRMRLLVELGKQQLRPNSSQMPSGDSARIFFQQAEELSARIGNRQWQEESQALIGVTYLVADDWKKGKAYFNKVIDARQRAGDKVGEMRARLRMFISDTYCTGEECGELQGNLRKALALCRQVGDKAWEVVILTVIGYIHMFEEDYKQAEHFARQALAVQKTIPYSALNRVYHAMAEESVYLPGSQYKDYSTAYSLLSDVGRHSNHYNQALFYLLQIVKDEETNGFKEALDYPYFVLGMIYYEMEQFSKSVQYFRQSLAISHYKGEVVVHVGMIRKMVQAMIEVGQARQALAVLRDITHQNPPLNQAGRMSVAVCFGLCYQGLKQYPLAEPYYLQAVSLSKQTAYEYQVIAQYQLCRFYVSTGQYGKADPYMKSIQNTFMKIVPEPRDELEFLLMRFKVDSARADYPSAINHYQRYTALKDSVFNETKSKQIEELGMQYETGKKEQDLKLKDKNIALLKEQNKAQQSQRNALIGGTALLLSLLALGYNRYHLKQRSNQLLEGQQQKLRAQQQALQAQHQELQAQKDVLQAQQHEINYKNEHLSRLLLEKDSLLGQKDTLLEEKEGLLFEKDYLLSQQERLLKEIHHRVKNNLQVVISLLNSQADSLKDKAALSAIQESQHRVQAMALIHQKLYQSQGVARIPIQDYIEEVVAYLSDSYNLSHPVRFRLDVEPIQLDVTQAVPLGLIINEVITNAFKYAFPGSRPGTVSLSLHRLEEATYRLTIADDGVGLPSNYDPSQSRSLGMTLLHGFSSQLGGELSITGQPGLTICLVFAEKQLSPSYARTDYAY
jgi:two-component sensor histidine kinase